MADLRAEALLLGEAVDTLAADRDAQQARVTTLQAELDELLAERIDLMSRWRMTWHALRLAHRALADTDSTCPDHDREWAGDCAVCERARLLHHTQVALSALDRPFPTRPIPPQ